MEDIQERSLLDKIKEKMKYHLVDTTAILAPTNPIFSAMEVGVSGMSDQVSIDSRLTVAAFSYAGAGWLYSKGRDLSRRIFHINDQTKERIQTLHDSAYTFGFNLLAMPIVYLSTGADLKQTAIGSVSAAALGVITGPIMGYSIDVARDLTGLQESDRASYPNLIKRQRPSIKKGLAGLLVAGSILAMAGIYGLTKDRLEQTQNNQTIEQIVSK
ncbi:L-alanine exporter AlaE [Candidatus Pacearchaeota archaeon]|nr:L-alanine exporter AlaE [Candidatus Pacearchaeota archaeon]